MLVGKSLHRASHALTWIIILKKSFGGESKLSLLLADGLQARQEHQVGRFLGIPEKRLTRRAYQRTHGKATSKINELSCADGHRKVGRDFSSDDCVPETTFHQRGGAGGRVLQELPDLSVVHKRCDAHEKTSPSGAFLGRSFDGVLQEGGERVAKRLRRQQRLRGESAFLLRIILA